MDIASIHFSGTDTSFTVCTLGNSPHAFNAFANITSTCISVQLDVEVIWDAGSFDINCRASAVVQEVGTFPLSFQSADALRECVCTDRMDMNDLGRTLMMNYVKGTYANLRDAK